MDEICAGLKDEGLARRGNPSEEITILGLDGEARLGAASLGTGHSDHFNQQWDHQGNDRRITNDCATVIHKRADFDVARIKEFAS